MLLLSFHRLCLRLVMTMWPLSGVTHTWLLSMVSNVTARERVDSLLSSLWMDLVSPTLKSRATSSASTARNTLLLQPEMLPRSKKKKRPQSRSVFSQDLVEFSSETSTDATACLQSALADSPDRTALLCLVTDDHGCHTRRTSPLSRLPVSLSSCLIIDDLASYSQLLLEKLRRTSSVCLNLVIRWCVGSKSCKVHDGDGTFLWTTNICYDPVFF